MFHDSMKFYNIKKMEVKKVKEQSHNTDQSFKKIVEDKN